MIDEHPLPWLAPLLNGVEHANFFETRATEYSKGATKGNWNEVWDSFDRRQKAKAANDTPAADGDPDMAIMVGDSATDVNGAKNAGVPVVAVSFGYTDVPAAKLGADAVIDRYDDLVSAIAKLASD